MEFQCEVMCRLCLRENDNFFSVFEVNKIYGYIPAIVISLLLDSQVSETDGYPQDVCLTCLNKLTEYKSFKEQCHSAKSRFDRNYGRKFNSSTIVPETEVRIVIKEESEGSESSEEPGVEIKEETEASESSEEILPAVKQETLTYEDEIVLNEQEILPQIKQEFSSSVEGNVENEQEDVLEIMQESSEIEEENDLSDQTEEESSSISDMDDQNLSIGTPDVLKTKRGKEKLLEYVCKERKNIRRTKMQWRSESRVSKEQQHRQSSNRQNCTLKKIIKQQPRAPWFVKPEPKKMLDKMKALAECTDLSIEDIISSVLPNLEMNEKYRLRLVSWLSRSIKNWREADNFNRVTLINRQGGLY